MALELTRAECLTLLLSRPDAPDLRDLHGNVRGHHLVRGGDSRNRDRIKEGLVTAYLTWEWQSANDISSVGRVRPKARIKIARRA